jgi:ABC-type nitrate/sulfonate/bicarbonate transport system substrate-binding protein
MKRIGRGICAALVAMAVVAGCTGTAATNSPTSSQSTAPSGSVASGVASAAPSPDTSPVVIGWSSPPDVGYLPLLMAIDDIKAQGYAISTVQLASDLTLQGLIQNSVQFANIGGLSAGSTAIGKGAPIKAIAARVSNEAVWTTLPEYADCKTLTGKPVGIFAAVSSYTSQMKAYFAANCPDVAPTYLTIPDSAARAQALAGGQIVATVLGLTDAVGVDEAAPGKFQLTYFGQALPGLGAVLFWSNDQTLKDHPQTVRALLEAQLKATRALYADPSQLPGLITKYSLKSAGADQYISKKLWNANGGLGGTGIEDSLKAFGLPGTRATIVDEGPMKDVLNAIGPSSATPN